MKLEEVLEIGKSEPDTNLGKSARAFVEAAAKFIEELAKDNVDLEFGEADDTTNVIDYNAPVSDSYKKTYKPITASEIVEANRQMSQAIAGEKFIAGFIAAIQLFLMVK